MYIYKVCETIIHIHKTSLLLTFYFTFPSWTKHKHFGSRPSTRRIVQSLHPLFQSLCILMSSLICKISQYFIFNACSWILLCYSTFPGLEITLKIRQHVSRPGSSKKNGWIKTSLIFIYLIDWVMLVLFLLMPSTGPCPPGWEPVIKWGYIIMYISNNPWSFRITTVMSLTFHIIPKDPSVRKEWLEFLPCFPDDSVLKDGGVKNNLTWLTRKR